MTADPRSSAPPDERTATTRGAVLSTCRTYRYSLWRHWGEVTAPRLIVLGLNPSTADETEDDPTIRRCLGFAKREGLAGLTMLNLFALRATDPKAMLAHPEPVGPQNDQMLRSYAWDAEYVFVAAWGALGGHRDRDRAVCEMLPNLRCFGTTKHGHPRHPLYLRADTPLEPFHVR